MQKVRTGTIKHYPNLRIFKDDIEALMTIFEKNFECTEAVIDSYKITKVSDIDLLKKQYATTLSIEGKPDYSNSKSTQKENATLTLGKNDARLYLSNEDDVQLRGIEYHIDSILSPRKKKTAFLSKTWIPALLSIFIFFICFIINQYTPVEPH